MYEITTDDLLHEFDVVNETYKGYLMKNKIYNLHHRKFCDFFEVILLVDENFENTNMCILQNKVHCYRKKHEKRELYYIKNDTCINMRTLQKQPFTINLRTNNNNNVLQGNDIQLNFIVPLHRQNAATIYHDVPYENEKYAICETIYDHSTQNTIDLYKPIYYNNYGLLDFKYICIRFCKINGELFHISDDHMINMKTNEVLKLTNIHRFIRNYLL